ncbi:MAG: helix-turn-helix domain-containing protein [Chlorobi bacterium]|nr:helix-turn-helix domain-containing protein [Chlorobiota bacterium]MCI0715679.1 helix-turn-helix domain-containing protein [Chlorobiota bacterium]
MNSANSMNSNNSISKFVKLQRKQNGLTQVDLSKKSGTGLRFVKELEAGKRTLRIDKVNDVLYLFGHELQPAKLKKDSV